MNLLMVGAGKGSWEMRGLQLGAALGARVTSTPTPDDWRWADCCVLIKKHGARWAPQAHAAGVPIVWDALDCWAQPTQNSVSPEQARQIVRAQQAVIRPVVTIAATEAMARDIDGVYLPHQARLGLVPTPARPEIRTVGYDGAAPFLGRWHSWFDTACAKRGWTFVVNPPDLSAVDLLVAVRDGVWDGWICREWKSGVKVVNAMAAGRPLISQPCAAIRELTAQVDVPMWSCLESVREIDAAFDAWTNVEARQCVVEACQSIAPRYTVDAVADQYRAILAQVEARCAA